jgi:hypothetical protein
MVPFPKRSLGWKGRQQPPQMKAAVPLLAHLEMIGVYGPRRSPDVDRCRSDHAFGQIAKGRRDYNRRIKEFFSGLKPSTIQAFMAWA